MSAVYLVKEKIGENTEITRAVFSTKDKAELYKHQNQITSDNPQWIEQWAVDFHCQ